MYGLKYGAKIGMPLRIENKWNNEKPKLDNARRLRRIYFIDPDNQEYKEILQLARRKLERPAEAAVPCQKEIHTGNKKLAAEVTTSHKVPKTIHGGIPRIHKATSGTFPIWKNTTTTLRAKVLLRWPITIRCTSSFPRHKRCKFLMQKQQWTRNGRSSRQSQHGNWRKSQVKKEVILETQRHKQKVHFATLMGICHIKNAELKPKFSLKVVSCSECDIVKDDSGTCAVFAEQGSFASQMTAAKIINGCYCKITRLWRTSSWCKISLHLSKFGGRSQIAQNSCVRKSSLGKHWRSCGTSRKKFIWTHTRRIVGKTIRGSFTGTWMVKIDHIGNVCLFLENKNFSDQFSRMTSKWLERSWLWLPFGRNWWQCGEPTSFLDSVYLGGNSTRMQTEWNHLWRIYKDDWITYFWWTNWKVTSNSRVVLRHGRTCSKMRWETLRVG